MLVQISVFVENEVGSLARVTAVLREEGINLRAIASIGTPEFGILRIIVDDPQKTKEVLTHRGFVVKASKVLAIELIDRPGELDRVLHIIADAGLTVNYIYSFVIRNEKSPLMVMHLDDMDRAEKILREHNITVAG